MLSVSLNKTFLSRIHTRTQTPPFFYTYLLLVFLHLTFIFFSCVHYEHSLRQDQAHSNSTLVLPPKRAPVFVRWLIKHIVEVFTQHSQRRRYYTRHHDIMGSLVLSVLLATILGSYTDSCISRTLVRLVLYYLFIFLSFFCCCY